MPATTLTLTLRGPGGEPVDLRRTFFSHGLTELPPMSVAPDASSLEVTLPLPRGKPRLVTLRGGGTRARVTIHGPSASAGVQREVRSRLQHILRLDEDLAGFYVQVKDDPDLGWVAQGAGRMVRGASVFEDVVKTVCTTNCSWSATTKMIGTLVRELGAPAAGISDDGARGRAFPIPVAMAEVPESFYRDEVRAGYRGAYLRSLATSVAEEEIDLEELKDPDVPDEIVTERLLALPGVGPYAAAHINMMIGRYSTLILDSWTRPKYAKLTGRKSVKDATIVRRFKPYGRWAGLAFWLFLTKDWLDETPGGSAES